MRDSGNGDGGGPTDSLAVAGDFDERAAGITELEKRAEEYHGVDLEEYMAHVFNTGVFVLDVVKENELAGRETTRIYIETAVDGKYEYIDAGFDADRLESDGQDPTVKLADIIDPEQLAFMRVIADSFDVDLLEFVEWSMRLTQSLDIGHLESRRMYIDVAAEDSPQLIGMPS